MPQRILCSRAVAGANLVQLLTVAALFSFQVLVALVAVLTTLAAARTEALGAAGRTAAEALTGGYRLAFAVGTGLLLAALAVAATVLRPRKTEAPTAPAATASGISTAA
ncbi:hypothetical protein [Streptomyces sp. NPDC085466]|uniref:hypothetical protein n=1 Tax=Streptomyces sp. NPDC085466 TaxID=3365725 RepID=UPI0037CD5CDB